MIFDWSLKACLHVHATLKLKTYTLNVFSSVHIGSFREKGGGSEYIALGRIYLSK